MFDPSSGAKGLWFMMKIAYIRVDQKGFRSSGFGFANTRLLYQSQRELCTHTHTETIYFSARDSYLKG